jgi:glycerol-3-phosphate acyltransferase PlsY
MIDFLIYLIVFGPILVAYLLGSFPTSYIVGKLNKIDISKIGSGNLGATNIFRALGFKWAVLVLFIDTLKGYLACSQDLVAIETYPFVMFSAILGHVFPIFTGFRGGKGVATTLGCLIAFYPQILIGVIPVFILVFSVSRVSSISVLVSSVLLAPTGLVLGYGKHDIFVLVLLTIFLFVTHIKNISRIIALKEPKLF